MKPVPGYEGSFNYERLQKGWKIEQLKGACCVCKDFSRAYRVHIRNGGVMPAIIDKERKWQQQQ